MSSGSSGHYQSRLFNFVHQQSRRVTQQWENTFRHLQVATKWGVETLIYSVYLLFQSSESNGKTLQTKEPQTSLKLQPNDTVPAETHLTVDTPIHQVLGTIQNLSSQEVTATSTTHLNPLAFLGTLWGKAIHHNSTTNTNSPQSLTISDNPAGSLNPSQSKNALQHNLLVVRGIATNLLNRNLVLVTAENEILDILTSQQQAKLEEKIISEVANYWYCWRLTKVRKENVLLPEINRLLAKLTGKSTSKIQCILEGTSEDLNLINKSKLLAFIDASVANLETKAVVPVQQRSLEIIQVVQIQLNTFLYGKERLATRGEIAVNADSLETHTLNFQALIEAALNYFFGVGAGKKLESSGNQRQLQRKRLPDRSFNIPKSPQLHNQDVQTDPWLNLSDLFGESKTAVNKPVAVPQRLNPVLASSVLPEMSVPKKVARSKAKSELVQKKKITRNLTSIQKTSGKIISAKQNQDRISQSKSDSPRGDVFQRLRQSTQMEAKPDWIETTATLMGYEKHPLEQLLEWLDSFMLWLEEIFVNIFHVLQKLWRGK
ncbi:hypothetical protein FNW02_26265 [Komarekiella sp. 'clone 1']|uniref:Uncharacterized protein n=1 Tax=Komarekiella delphini-convector SJRDD-AB1 TaxID=2593771 RepID=A0AA40T1H2_9NOST|nr:hypothetical protein [Komarekiella delphini-convector]MBD6619236.1 hypothetical protein [Komarekiella delphini-convector SJRDD-AB1]